MFLISLQKSLHTYPQVGDADLPSNLETNTKFVALDVVFAEHLIQCIIIYLVNNYALFLSQQNCHN